LKRIVHCFTTILTVFVFGYLLWHSADVSNFETNDLSKEIGFQFRQNDYQFNAEGTKNESFSLKSNQQNQSNVNEVVVKKQVQTPFVFTSFAQIELVQKNSFEVFFGKKNILNLFFTTSRIIFPFHYFW